jgi:hypothetical protein
MAAHTARLLSIKPNLAQKISVYFFIVRRQMAVSESFTPLPINHNNPIPLTHQPS